MGHDAGRRQIRLGLFVLHAGYHLAGWRHPDARSGGADFGFMRETALIAERGLFDLFFLPDTPTASRGASPSAAARLEPLTLLSALAAVTTDIGLVATASTTYNEPFNLARQIASLDHLSGGRAAWNIVTTLSAEVAASFGRAGHLPHAQRYARAAEFIDVAKGLWDSWDDDAFVRDKASGVYFDKAKLHYLDHEGAHFSVRGPLSLARPPQGHPLLVLAGASDEGQALAAQVADIVFSAQNDRAEAQAFYAGVKRRAAAAGRDASRLLVFPGVLPILGATEAQSRAKFDHLQSLVDMEQALPLLSFFLGHDVSGLPLDEPLPELSTSDAMKSRTELLTGLARNEKLTVRELARIVAAGRGHLVVVGSPVQVADTLERWFLDGAADGFNVMVPYLPGGLEDFVDGVVPILQARGLYKTAYAPGTLRDRLGLPRPPSRYATPSSPPQPVPIPAER
ncbi:LLM class flavin-dependent oxidoreductase [Xanthobacter oligotrophicus]|uniref:LLM class flavin-dependent oxidoreductase n=1 Tax=Xanthobacter oligotrophicus TaxID=2607286 RepID=UPI0011F3C2DB|nr:LLM class flavin-dependent oxidoreductase [Xanthobacter oligotrophicus]MCG5235354.1 LLM class flavin-dependent oxidoreductase [Xanthobacter oligotrophicus]